MADRPNMVIVMSDQHSGHILGCSGDKTVETPNMDSLAAEGVRFTHTYCPAPLCVPSRMGFLTGRQCSDIDVLSNQHVLASDIPTFLHSLSAAGYETVLCGRMHFSHSDHRHGFEKRLVGDVTYQWPGTKGIDLGDIPLVTAMQTRETVEISGAGRTSYQQFDREVTGAAINFIRTRKASERPFCLVVGFVLPHCPFICPRELFDRYFEKVDIPKMSEEEKTGVHPVMKKWKAVRKIDRPLSEKQIRTARATYYGLVTMVDTFVGEILSALEEKGRRKDTAFFYTSDHGEMAGAHEMWWKTNFYEGATNVPLIASFPEVFKQSAVCRHPVSLLDLAPTFIEMAGAQPLPQSAGKSLMPCLSGTCEGRQRADIFSELNILPELQGFPIIPGRMIVRWPWKLIHYHGFPQPQLFNLETDPGETKDLRNDPACEGIKKKLHAAAKKGWSGKKFIEATKDNIKNYEMVKNWAKAANPPIPERWVPPEGCNVFPE